jgi:hypothetical protein
MQVMKRRDKYLSFEMLRRAERADHFLSTAALG